MEKVVPHSLGGKIAHWGFAAVFLFALTKQLDEVEELEDFSLLQYEMAFATFFLVLLVIRFVFMRRTRPTAMPADMPKRTRLAAQIVHMGMYIGVALIAVSGLVIGGLYWAEIKSGIMMEAALLVHEIAVNTTYWLIAGHIAASIYHRRQGDGLWDAMVPVWKEPKSDS